MADRRKRPRRHVLPGEVAALVVTPWDEARAARVQRRVLDAMRAPESASARLELPGGSFALLEPAAHVAVRSAGEELQLHHLTGVAHYEVPSGPVIVRVEATVLEARAASFRVERTEAFALVVVSRGRVRVTRDHETLELPAGEQLKLS